MWRAFKIKEPSHTVEEARPVSTRFGARTVRVVSVRGNGRMCTPDLVKSAASWATQPPSGVPHSPNTFAQSHGLGVSSSTDFQVGVAICRQSYLITILLPALRRALVIWTLCFITKDMVAFTVVAYSFPAIFHSHIWDPSDREPSRLLPVATRLLSFRDRKPPRVNVIRTDTDTAVPSGGVPSGGKTKLNIGRYRVCCIPSTYRTLYGRGRHTDSVQPYRHRPMRISFISSRRDNIPLISLSPTGPINPHRPIYRLAISRLFLF
jgi:hypothetical protein